MKEWLTGLLAYLVLFPSAASCYLPVNHQLKRSPGRTAAGCLALLVPFSLAGAWAYAVLGLQFNYLLFPMIPMLFLFYFRTVKTDFPRALAVFSGVCAVESFPCQLGNALHTYLYPQDPGGESVESLSFQLALSLLLLAGAWFIRRYYVWVIDHLDFPRIWFSTVAISSVFVIFNVVSTPEFFGMYYVGHVYFLFPVLELCTLALLLCVYMLFYQGARRILERAQMEQRTQLLEMQSHQYRALQEHMERTARLRHDFRHSVRLLSDMARHGDMDGILTYLTQYEGTLAESAAINYCANVTLNALFRYYHEMAVSAGIKIVWKLELPDPLTVSELDLASLFGNILENGIEGCQTLPERKRYFNLTAELRHGNRLYIVATNSFDGHVKKGKTGYRSTKHSGAGIGLVAVAAVAEKYGGVLQVSNSESEFFTDVELKL